MSHFLDAGDWQTPILLLLTVLHPLRASGLTNLTLLPQHVHALEYHRVTMRDLAKRW